MQHARSSVFPSGRDVGSSAHCCDDRRNFAGPDQSRSGQAATDPRDNATNCTTATPVDPTTQAALINQVVRPNLAGTSPTDTDAIELRPALNDQLRHALSTMYDALYANRPQRYPLLWGDRIGRRAHTTTAMALAIATELGGFDPARAGVSVEFARAHAEQTAAHDGV
jgi:hypothetical protein